MPASRLIDYYKLLAVPPDVDLMGIENAYVRLSDELVRLAEEDEESSRALNRLNEAYTVLANAETRRKYDRMLFAAEYDALERKVETDSHRRSIARTAIVGALGIVVAVQGSVLVWMTHDYVVDTVRAVLGPLFPGSAA